jgi:hypothetical protein
MAYQVVLHEKAHHEYIAAYRWYEQEQKGLGDKFTSGVEKCLKQISENPLHYSILKLNYRHIRVKEFPFSIVFELLPRKT